MSPHEYNSSMTIGTDYTPSGENKYIEMRNVEVSGFLTAPEDDFHFYIGRDGTVKPTTTLTPNSLPTAFIIPNSIAVSPNNDYVTFQLGAQVNYITDGIEYLQTEQISIKINTPAPTGMTDFVVGPTFVPSIKAVAAQTPLIAEPETGVYKIDLLITLNTFKIPASGEATVKIPLALF